MKNWLRKLRRAKVRVTIEEIEHPEFILEVGSASGFLSVLPDGEPLQLEYRPDILSVPGDTLEINWSIEVTYDPERNVVSIHSNGEYQGTFAAEDGWRSVHKIRGRYKTSPEEEETGNGE